MTNDEKKELIRKARINAMGKNGLGNSALPIFITDLEKEMTNETQKTQVQNLIITKDDLKQINVLDKPTDTQSRLVWIMRTIAYEYGRGKKGCRIPLNEICINGLSLRKQGDEERYKFEKDVSKPLEQAGYAVNMMFNMELIGDCLEIVWG
jgi:hypothetical protein